jgi:hypothetical protein
MHLCSAGSHTGRGPSRAAHSPTEPSTPRADLLSRPRGRLCPMMNRVRLRQMSLEKSPWLPSQFDLNEPAAPEPPRALSALLVFDTAGTSHLVAIPDVVAFLIAMLSNRPFRAFAQELTVRRVPPESVEVRMSRTTGQHVSLQMTREQWYIEIMGLVKETVTELSRLGAGALAHPLLAILAGTASESS